MAYSHTAEISVQCVSRNGNCAEYAKGWRDTRLITDMVENPEQSKHHEGES